MNRYIFLVIIISTIITFFLRAFPFLFFNEQRKMPAWLDRLGQRLPASIMAILIIYCLKDLKTSFLQLGIPSFIAVIVVVMTYHIKRNTLLSITLSTLTYMILLNLF